MISLCYFKLSIQSQPSLETVLDAKQSKTDKEEHKLNFTTSSQT